MQLRGVLAVDRRQVPVVQDSRYLVFYGHHFSLLAVEEMTLTTASQLGRDQLGTRGQLDETLAKRRTCADLAGGESPLRANDRAHARE